MQIHLDTVIPTGKTESDYAVDYLRGETLTVSVRNETVYPAPTALRRFGGSSKVQRLEPRIYFTRGSRVITYSPASGEATMTAVANEGALDARLRSALSPVPDPIKVIVDASFLQALLKDVSHLGGMRVRRDSQGTIIERTGRTKTKTAMRIRFNSHGLIAAFYNVVGKNHYHWTIAYSPAYHEFHLPSDVLMVKELGRLPRFGEPSAKSAVRSMLKAERSLGSKKIHVEGDGRRCDLYVSQGMVRQDSPGYRWAYDGRFLTLSAGKSFYRGRASRADILDYLAYLVKGPDPLARTLLLRETPFEDYFSAQYSVRLAGSMNIQGSDVNILQIAGKGTHASLFIREKDRLVAGVESDALDAGGHAAEHEHCRFYYKNASFPASFFRIPQAPGSRLRPLPVDKLGPGSSHYKAKRHR